MKFFLDTEFIEYPHTIDLISIALVCEGTGLHYYVWNSECDTSKANEWVKEVVLPFAPEEDSDLWKSKERMAGEIEMFVENNSLGQKPEFWGYYCDYDWVVFCWLFGRMLDLPEGWPKYCLDLKQWYDQAGAPFPKPEMGEGEHNALVDARWNMKLWESLRQSTLVRG